ncbi:hypothetical protein N9057_06775, partial [Akkermansiaceae bacterium]|nr:hypothetical protein [Akkermansiaceae bacterium]
PLRPDDPEELILTLKIPRLALAFASGLEDDESAVLPRLPGLKTLLDEFYPEAKFRDFQVGDLRGAFRVESKDDVPE